jgi:glucose-6-phosphate 1-dehydrogenase
LAFRFANLIFSPAWDRKYIDHIQITAAEILGVETRGNFFEGVGTLRDAAQSHLLELLAAVTMREPQRFDAEGIRAARTKSIEQLIPITPEEVGVRTVRGQYGRGKGEGERGKELIGYREEPNVFSNSNTETFVALKLHSSDPKWDGVPFYLRTGKRLAQKATEISVVFKEPPLKMLKGVENRGELIPNILTFRIEPNEGIELTLNAKKVGFETIFEKVPMSFVYKKEKELTGPYERLLMDAMRGDQTLFTRTDEVAAAWRIISNISRGWWDQGTPPFPNYSAGSWGPKEAEELIKSDGREWLLK